jgi:hypothetical protein
LWAVPCRVGGEAVASCILHVYYGRFTLFFFIKLQLLIKKKKDEKKWVKNNITFKTKFLALTSLVTILLYLHMCFFGGNVGDFSFSQVLISI